MNVVEICKCGGSVRVVGSPAQAALQVASFRDAHKVCREPAYEVVSIPTISERQGKTPHDDLPCGKCGGDRLRPMFGQGGEACHAPSKVEP